MSGVWVVAEHSQDELLEVTLEMLGEGRKVASKLGHELTAVLLGRGVAVLCEPLGHYGAERVYLVEHTLLSPYTTDAHAAALTWLIRRWQPSIVLLGATANGQDLAPRVAARLRTGLVPDCVTLKVNSHGVLEMTRPTYRDKSYTTVVCPDARPIMATVRPGVIGTHKPDMLRRAEVVECAVELHPASVRTRVAGCIKADPATVDIAEAEVVVEGGLGVGQAGRWALIEELARAVGGSVGGSRMAMDAGWIPRERLVGLTGKSIASRLVISCGISGAMQHMAGLKDAKTLVAINKDRNAPILKQADLGVVADMHALIPALVEELCETRRGTEQQ